MKICKKCPKTTNDFKNERSFYHHEKTHEEKNEERPDCDKLFRTKIDLSSHRNNVHNEKQEYKCNHCEEIFSKRSNLKRHIDALEDNSNSGSNKVINIVYNCDECNEEYMDKRSLKRHEKTNMTQQELSITAHPVKNHLIL